MIDLELLRVSLTKNGYFKVAELLKAHSRRDVLDNAFGVHEGINIIASQIGNMLDANAITNDVPEYWDEIRDHGWEGIDALTVVAMLMAHHRIIRIMQSASQGRPEFNGYFLRDDFPQNKEYTNFAYALACFGLSVYRPGAGAVEYSLAPVVYHLRDAGKLVRDLLAVKMLRAGWRDPASYKIAPDRDLMTELQAHNIHRVFSMEWPRFSSWLNNRLRMAAPAQRFGIREVRLFKPIELPKGK